MASTFNEIALPAPQRLLPLLGLRSSRSSRSANDGKIYIAYAAKPSDRPRDDADIYVVQSDDAGQTWSRPKRLNDDDTDTIQFFPSIDVAPNGTVHAMWGDMRDDPAETRFHIYYTSSTDGGETWGFEIPDLDQTPGRHARHRLPVEPQPGLPGRPLPGRLLLAHRDRRGGLHGLVGHPPGRVRRART